MTDIFVFGSNLAGRHGAGAALFALRERGAMYGLGVGLHGHSYAIPTKDMNVRTLPLDKIADYVAMFLDFARLHPKLIFEVTPIGCGLAGYKRSEIEPLFEDMPSNCYFSKSWDEHPKEPA